MLSLSYRPRSEVGGATQLYVFICPYEPRVRCTLSVVAHSVGYGGGGEKGKLVQIMKKCNEYRG